MTDDTDPTRPTDGQHDRTLPRTVREGLRDATTPLATTDPTTGDAVASVAARLADADLVGLGEATHGTREFFELKHRLLRQLVVDHAVRCVALESSLPETMALHDHVVRGDGDPRDALGALGSWVWQVESVLSMVEWLRAFNADRPADDRVAVFGFGGNRTRGAVQRLRDHLASVDPAVLDDLAGDLATVDDGGGSSTTDDVDGWTAAADRVVGRLREHLDERRAAHVAATSERAWARARRYVAVVEQVRTRTEALGGFEGDVRDPAEYIRRMGRAGVPGEPMADNVAWVRDHAAADTLVLWAHDAHLHRGGWTLPGVDASAPSLGSQLAERHGGDYHAVGFSFGRGVFQAVGGDADGREQHLDGPLAGTVDEALDGLDEPLAFVDLRAARDDDRTADWLAEPRPQFRTGGAYDPAAPEDHLVASVYADAFDGLCFVAETTRARPIAESAGGNG